jgi:hypothetical protein
VLGPAGRGGLPSIVLALFLLIAVGARLPDLWQA